MGSHGDFLRDTGRLPRSPQSAQGDGYDHMNSRLAVTSCSAPQRGRLNPRDNLVRAIAATLLKECDSLNRSGVEEIIARRWPDDPVSPFVARAAVPPATMTQSGWASHLASTSVADFL